MEGSVIGDLPSNDLPFLLCMRESDAEKTLKAGSRRLGARVLQALWTLCLYDGPAGFMTGSAFQLPSDDY